MRVYFLLFFVCLAACSQMGSQSGTKPRSPKESLNSIKMAAGDVRVSLFASEPMVVDPVDMVFDEQGRAFVADMLDLPYDPPKGKAARGRIIMLEDIDGDGVADKSTVFAENVLQVSGLMVWKGGLIVPSAPNIYYMKDTDGDGKADVREVLFTGFYQGNPEGQITNPRLSLDNWIYFSNAGNAGRITSPKWPQHPALEVRGMDLRFHPLRNSAETSSGPAQFGSTFDDWGNHFISQNTQHLRHVMVPMHYLARSPLLEVAAVNNDPYGKRERLMWPLTEAEEWRVVRTKIRQQRYNDSKSGRVEHVAGHITGAAGGTVYNGDALPESYRGNLFTGDVSGNLVRQDILTPAGLSVSARPVRENVEFLASTDSWFRPACFANAPDGNLYMMDMYRQTIETPLSIPEDIQKRLKLDFYRGDDMGRIYRISAKEPTVKRGLKVNLGKMSASELVRELANRNGWHRQTAQRLLVERQDKSAEADLREMAYRHDSPLARLHAYWTLEGIGVLREADVVTALKDQHAGIREHAVRFSESIPATPVLERALLEKLNDAEPRVRYQLAYTMGNYKSAQAKSAVVELAAKNGADQWFRVATLSSAADWPADFLAMLLARPENGWQTRDMLRSLGSLIGARRKNEEIEKFAAAASRLKQPELALDGLARGLDMSQAKDLPLTEALLSPFLNAKSAAQRRAAWSIASHAAAPALFTRAAREAADEKAALENRVMSVSALRGAKWEIASPVIQKILSGSSPAALQTAAIDAIGAFRRPEATAAILSGWKSYPPDTRTKAVNALLSQRDRIPVLLTALENGTAQPAMIEMNARNRLLEDKDRAISARASKIFSSASADRDKVVAQFRDVVKLAGDPVRGKPLFEEHCAKCHLNRRRGGRVGPDLSGVNNKSKEELLEAILNPSRSIEPRFVNYIITAKDGQMFDGVLAAETPGAVTLRGGAEEDVTILRSNIQEIRSSAISLMPEEFEKNLSKQGLADVIAYLRAGL
ncbi:MAG: c-type cytochrome [Candidatus Solibacter usitatus]|nr:c-type cytochrome [Candidatus Solibacter usitatus]